jgi:DNA-binding response OmpR family regulator
VPSKHAVLTDHSLTNHLAQWNKSGVTAFGAGEPAIGMGPEGDGGDAMSSSVPLLLVEDEPLIIDVLEFALTDSGYEVSKANSGTQALENIDAYGSRYRAIVTDIKLGRGHDGWAVAKRARELFPRMPIVYMSGDSASEWASKGVPGSVILAKPFAPAQLVTAVSTLVTEADMHAPPSTDSQQ